jgi:hypothetical protein
MDLWYPPDDQPPLLEWWTPLLLASAAARREHVPWPVHADEFTLQGRVDRGARPAIWVYQHGGSGQELYLDDTGRPYRFTKTPNGRSYGRFTTSDIRSAILRAGLPSHVEPVWYDDPLPPRYESPRLPLDDLDAEPWPSTGAHRHASAHRPEGAADEPLPRHRRGPRPGARRGHLTLIQGGRQAG